MWRGQFVTVAMPSHRRKGKHAVLPLGSLITQKSVTVWGRVISDETGRQSLQRASETCEQARTEFGRFHLPAHHRRTWPSILSSQVTISLLHCGCWSLTWSIHVINILYLLMTPLFRHSSSIHIYPTFILLLLLSHNLVTVLCHVCKNSNNDVLLL